MISDFYQQDTTTVARKLVGCFLVSNNENDCQRYQITETEAYLGPEDAASHARFGKTGRSQVMYEAGGTLYVYLIYGMYYMLNIVTGPAGKPGAVLIRGVRGADGPGKLTKKLGITKQAYNGELLGEETGIWIDERPDGFDPGEIQELPRIGIDYASDEWRMKPLRFRWEGGEST